MNCKHELKIKPTCFEKILLGTKRFDVRRNFRNFSVGDTILYTNEKTQQIIHVKITDVLDITHICDNEYSYDGMVVIGIERGSEWTHC